MSRALASFIHWAHRALYSEDEIEVLRVLLDEEKPSLEDPKTWKLGGEGWKEDGREPEHDLTDYRI